MPPLTALETPAWTLAHSDPLDGDTARTAETCSFSCPEKNLESASDMDCTVEGLKKKHVRTLTSGVQQTEIPVRDALCWGRGAAAFWTSILCHKRGKLSFACIEDLPERALR